MNSLGVAVNLILSNFAPKHNISIMKTYRLMIICCVFSLLIFSCSPASRTDGNEFADYSLEFVEAQLRTAIAELDRIHAERFPEAASAVVVPRSLREDTMFYVPSRDWTSGFFGGNLWYLYELTGNEYWKEKAMYYTAPIEKEKTNKGTHDLGFMLYCSFGNGYRLTGNEQYKEILLEAARSLISRYNPTVGCIRSWDFARDRWMFPVIIDNMMNLELLFWATKVTGDSTFYHIAVSHADVTMKHHFRDDNSSYHVIDFDTITGEVRNRHTHQGYSHESGWARGQAWGLYGYTMCYRETGKKEYLEQAEKIAGYMLNHTNMPEDLVPYWDYNAPNIPNEPRDVSAATIMSSALLELRDMIPEKYDYYNSTANKILENVWEKYRSAPNSNKGFILDNSTGHLPGKHEINVPIIYADYYFLEALLRIGAKGKII
jgi:unsaturated chondroitin disaccharide hydrolase